MHYGHINALRQAKSMCDELIVGIHSSAEIRIHKTHLPIMGDDERYTLVRACRWVDYVVEDAPYTTSLRMMELYDIDFAVHGDDLTTTETGENSYQAIIDNHQMRYFTRTPGVSSSEIVQWILTGRPTIDDGPARKVLKMCENPLRPCQSSKGKVVGLIDGAWDVLTAADVRLLAAAKSMVDILIIGVKTDERPNAVLSLAERCVVLAGCKYVDRIVDASSQPSGIDVLFSAGEANRVNGLAVTWVIHIGENLLDNQEHLIREIHQSRDLYA
ncbi:phosphoethanolamine cytidylyltransferase [Perkinsela sp. CCAP 1560/4]|nr:phosphoethanolamine cytidylyltransferase [Perkinsela sp. CCAP 1560/4]|eukprot:KNH07276.1 phosphoethanolamine cytidylyltransferase [Perkinsela sp. CCAP 1560/4]